MKNKLIDIILIILLFTLIVNKLPVIKYYMWKLKWKTESKIKARYIYNSLKLKEYLWKQQFKRLF